MCFRFPFAEFFAISEELFSFLLVIAIICVVVMMLRRAGRSNRSGHPRRAAPGDERAAETEMLARMIDQLDKMERRMQNLETIITDKESGRKDREERR